MDLKIKGKRALVTGAGRGIGRAVAMRLADEGAKVSVFSRTSGEIESLVKAMGGSPAGHYGEAFDLMPENAPEILFEKLKKNFGAVDILIHNLGGTLNVRNPFCSTADWRKVWRLNFEVAAELDRLFIPAMQERKWGRVVHVASTASMENNGPTTYCAVKAALLAYSRSMARILAPTGVVMSAILPGAVVTEGGHWEKAMKERPEHVKKYLEERCPLGRFGKPEDIAAMVAFLSSELADFCQGSIVPVDGGQSRHYFLGQ